MNPDQQQAQFEELIAKGKMQGFLTFSEVNDHLPNNVDDPDQMDDIISIINGLGIQVHEEAPERGAVGEQDGKVKEPLPAGLGMWRGGARVQFDDHAMVALCAQFHDVARLGNDAEAHDLRVELQRGGEVGDLQAHAAEVGGFGEAVGGGLDAVRLRCHAGCRMERKLYAVRCSLFVIG